MKNHPWAWLIWFSALAIISLVTRNPLYALLLLGVSRLALELHANSESSLGFSFGRAAFFVLLFSTIYAALFIHIGSHILFKLPSWPLIGGAITLEAVFDGLRNGLVLIALISIFLAFNAIIPIGVLVRLIPDSLKDLGVVLLVAVTYVPETRRQLSRIREAQAIRGHEVRALKDWQPIIIPLLVGGFERSLRLSETMVARGYGSSAQDEHSLSTKGGLLIIVAAAFSGWIVLWAGQQLGWILILLAIILLAVLVLRSSSQGKRTTYRTYDWSLTDTIFAAAAILSLAIILIPWPFVDRLSLSYSPYPELTFPNFDFFIGIALVLMAVPVLLTQILGDKTEPND